jgi:imidazolonepropionase
MRRVTLIRGARQLLTLRGPSGPRRGTDLGNLAIIQDGAVLIADGLIVEVGPTRRVENLALAREAKEIDASGCVVMPGFVDSHVPVVRGAGQELSPRALKTLALHGVEEAVRCGTTAMEVKSSPGLTEAEALKALRVYAALRELPLTIVSTFLTAGVERLLPMVCRRKLAEYAEVGRETVTLARQLGLGVKVGAGAIVLAVEIGAITVDEVAEATERDALMLAHSPTIAILSPGFEKPYAPARMLIDNGAAVALATGVHPANMQISIALACRAMKMTAAEAISASTINGAHAIGRAGSIGSIEAGKSADLSILAVPDYRELPDHFGMNLVNLIMIRGAAVVAKSEMKWPDR